jgi:erythromycin esterase
MLRTTVRLPPQVGRTIQAVALSSPEIAYVTRLHALAFRSALGITLGIALSSATPLLAQDDRVAWLRANAVALSDTATDAQLTSIRGALDGVDVVFLGESSHGDGGAHLARVRLVRYLHEQLGFNVIAWEAGVSESVAFDSLLGTSRALGTITPIALYPWWSASAELRPVLDYVRRTRTSPKPLRFAGFDIQRSGPLDSLVSHVSRTFGRSGNATLFPRTLGDTLTRLLRRMSSLSGAARDTVEDAAERLLHESAPELEQRFASNRAAFVRAIGARDTELFARTLANITAHAEQSRLAGDADAAKRIASYNLREQRNAANILWLLRSRHPGEKMIVWLHNVHAINTRFTARFDGVAPASTDTPRDATARVVRDSIGARSYAMATMSFDGAWAFPGGNRTELPPAPAGSLAAALHDAGFARAFLDLRRETGRPSWLSTPLTGTINTQSPARYPVVWPHAVDGVLFVDRMTPSTTAPE